MEFYSTVERHATLTADPLFGGLFHVACCGVPLLVIAVLAGVVALADAVAITAAAAAVAVLTALWRRRRSAQQRMTSAR